MNGEKVVIDGIELPLDEEREEEPIAVDETPEEESDTEEKTETEEEKEPVEEPVEEPAVEEAREPAIALDTPLPDEMRHGGVNTLGDLIRYADESQKFIGRQSSEVAELRRQIEELRQATVQKKPDPSNETRTPDKKALEDFYAELEKDPIGAINNLSVRAVEQHLQEKAKLEQEYAAKITDESSRAYETIKAHFPDVEEYRQEMATLIAENPQYFRQFPTMAAALYSMYREAKLNRLELGRTEEAKKSAETKRKEKDASLLSDGSGGGDAPDYESMSFDELERMLPSDEDY